METPRLNFSARDEISCRAREMRPRGGKRGEAGAQAGALWDRAGAGVEKEMF